MSKKAIVFGATSGIGQALSRLLVKDGYQVIITGRRKERLEALKKESPEQYIVRKHDITEVDDSKVFFEELADDMPQVDLIVHNAGIGENNFDLEWEKDLPTLETNVVGATMIYQLSYNFFKNQGFGHLVSITSIASLVGNRHVPAYHASKAFQSSYMESLWMKARKTKKAKITVTNILPGYVDTDIITGPTFWMAPLDKAVNQIYTAIKKKKRKAYVTKRWRLVAMMMKILPPQILVKFL
ncbi:SDR family NAD(P)-dependent oxidoreductase [Lutimonas sp.]|uniref:SDR family NAD(P)-dependent oxidoreductase n=1 Tax=Lutimonas sp. TaxID=1872403 RepID=UPI003D9BF58D